MLLNAQVRFATLAEAKRWYRRTYPNEPPGKWAAFIPIGDNGPVRLKKRRHWWPGAVGGAISAVLIGAWSKRRQRLKAAA